MGWLSSYYWTSQKDVEADILERDDSCLKVVDKSSKSGKLWVLFEDKNSGDRFVALYLIRSFGGVRFERGEWGYKDMDESMGPCYYDCPQRLLKGSTVPDTSGWRQKCLDRVQRQSALRKIYKTLKRGDILVLHNEDTKTKRELTFNYLMSATQFVANTTENKVFRFPMASMMRWDTVEIIRKQGE